MKRKSAKKKKKNKAKENTFALPSKERGCRGGRRRKERKGRKEERRKKKKKKKMLHRSDLSFSFLGGSNIVGAVEPTPGSRKDLMIVTLDLKRMNRVRS